MFTVKIIRISLTRNARFYSANSGGGNPGLLSKLVDNLRKGLDKRKGVEGAVGKVKDPAKKGAQPVQKTRPNVAETNSSEKRERRVTDKGNDSTNRPSILTGQLEKETEKISSLGAESESVEAQDLPSVFRKPSEDVTIISDTRYGSHSKGHPEYEDLPPDEERHKEWKENERKKLNKKAMVPLDFFRDIKDKNKENFLQAVDIFIDRDIRLRGHVEFIYAALKEMKTFGIHRDMEAYKRLIDVFPKGRLIASNRLEVEFMHYPKQQQCGLDLLEQMEEYGVMPDSEVHEMLTNIFGSLSYPMRKAMRMQYWMPKFKNLSPWPIPSPPPEDALELAKLAIQRITSVDQKTKITIFDAADLEDAIDHTWIVSGQSVDQQELIEKHPPGRPIYVEGAFRVWLGHSCINYFILRAEPNAPVENPKIKDPSDVANLDVIFEESYVENVVATTSTVHEQEDGNVLAVCATGSSSRDSVVSWIRFLEENNPRLGKDVSVLFTFRSPIGTTDDLEILSESEAKKQVQISQGQGTIGTGLGLNPSKPDLRNVGVWTNSDSQFVNWPHNPQQRESQTLLQMRDKKRAISDSHSHSSTNSDSISTDQSCSSSSSSSSSSDTKNEVESNKTKA